MEPVAETARDVWLVPRQLVARYEEMDKAMVGYPEASKQELQAAPLAENMGQKH